MNTSAISTLVSIIIPVYKVREYIEECIESVLRQSYQHIEIILVDDVGNDGSIELAENLLKQSDRKWCILKHENNRGLSAARNTGIKQATGEYIYFLDSDDYIDRTCIEKLTTAALQHHAQLVFGGYAYYYGNNITQKSPWIYAKTEKPEKSPLQLYLEQKLYAMACNVLINKKFYSSTGIIFQEGLLHEDAPWSFSLILRAKEVAWTEGISYYYRMRQGSITNAAKFNKKRIASLYYNLENCTKESHIHDIWDNKDFKIWYAREIVHFCVCAVCKSLLSQNEKRDILDRVFKELRLPEEELQSIKKFRFAKMFSFILPGYRWVWLIHWYNKLRAKLK